MKKSDCGIVCSDDDLQLNDPLYEMVKSKIAVIKEEKNLKRVFAIVMAGDKDNGEKDYYIGYFRRPNMHTLGTYMSMMQKDVIQATYNLAKLCFIEGDSEMIDDEELFCYGTMAKVAAIIESRQAEMVKL